MRGGKRLEDCFRQVSEMVTIRADRNPDKKIYLHEINRSPKMQAERIKKHDLDETSILTKNITTHKLRFVNVQLFNMQIYCILYMR